MDEEYTPSAPRLVDNEDDRSNPEMYREHAPSAPRMYGEYDPSAPRSVDNDDDPSNPISFIRDPHKLIAYVVPFPKPELAKQDPATIPERFLIYTPPPPPLVKPTEGVKEGKIHKVQRKWQKEVRDAKTSTAKTASWKGVKSKVMKGISWAVDRTTTTNLDFLGRVADNNKMSHTMAEEDQHANDGFVEGDEHATDRAVEEDEHAKDGVVEEDTTRKTVGVEELVLVYPATMGDMSPDQIREEFVNTMLRTKTKAERDAIISTALLPVTYGIDILAMVVWPFGGLGEIDTVWAYSSIRGAKTARSVTKRLSSSTDSESQNEGKLVLNFIQSERVEVLRAYLVSQCQKQNPKLFPSSGEEAPTEEQVLSAIGWTPSTEREQNWEDEQWERKDVQSDLKNVMRKGAKEWVSWCKAFERNPEKAVKK